MTYLICTIILSGMLFGYLLRKQRLPQLPNLIKLSVWMLLFLLGVEVGMNPRILQGLHHLGMEAFVLSIAGIMGSCVLSLVLWKTIQKHHER